MHQLASVSLLTLALAAASAAYPQPGPGPGNGPGFGPGAGPCVAASGVGAAGADCPRGMRRGGGMMGGPGARWGRDYTFGWALMSREEQQQHRDKMLSFGNYDECKAYLEQHHALMADRAKAQGRPMPAQPRREACATLAPRK
ncbi:MAG: hypothetical protein KF891_04620 [Rhizobacter sp.]|nr:hypothetical protein [Rhizobacter sp.]